MAAARLNRGAAARDLVRSKNRLLFKGLKYALIQLSQLKAVGGTDVRQASEPQSDAAVNRRTATRAALLDAVYASCPALSRAQAREIFEMALEEIAEALVRGECVKLRSFGMFAVRSKRERIGRNPRTGVEAPIKSRRVLTFKPSPVLSACVNGLSPEEAKKAEE
ncbi:Integration host factor subunit alpha (modular protein) [Methylocella tundrae]|uniref:Integration host factor subunit alpha n=1 Tax=Methylocella tundrae TaxID=227605 RepID=A0A8B6M4Y5_METTU|nr:Integration host factor subunit alpha (modular protein) [Methylocella tundrae]